MKIHLTRKLPIPSPRGLRASVFLGLLIALSPRPAPAAQPPSEKNGDLDPSTPEATAKAGEPQESPELGATSRSRHKRPRTLAAAREQQASLTDLKTKKQQSGTQPGLQNADSDVRSLEVYCTALFAAVEQHWHDLLDEMRVMPHSCKVVLEFILHSDGHVSGINITDGQEEYLFGLLCQRAVLDPVPHNRWPAHMQRTLGADQNRVTITFYHYREISNRSRSKLRRNGDHFICDLSYPLPTIPYLIRSSPAVSAYPWLDVSWGRGWPLWFGDDLFHDSYRKEHSKRVLCDWPKKDFPRCPRPLPHPPKCVVPQRLP